MLYPSWRRVSAARRDQWALWDYAGGRRWTFGQLADEADSLPSIQHSIHCPAGRGPDFIFQVLRGWRDGVCLCPLEQPGESLPVEGRVESWPLEIVHLKLTSASTGPRRLICFTGEQMAADARNIVSTMGLRSDWPNLGVISLAHSYGFSNLVLPLLLHGIPLVLLDSPLPSRVMDAVASLEALTLPAVPALWKTWLEGGAISARVRLGISAGAPLPLSLEEEIFQRHQLKVHNFYGSSECGGIAYDRTEQPRQEEQLVGSALDGVFLAVGDNGCLQVSGAAVGWGYWPESPEVLAAGRFRTADLVTFRNSDVLLTGRRSDQINVAGRKVSPESIELVLLKLPGVSDCLVFGIPAAGAMRAETVVACVQAAGGMTREKLREYAQSQLPDWQVPREWWFVEQIGTTERGKRSRPEWRERYLAQRRNSQ